jgi:hypothetical protein
VTGPRTRGISTKLTDEEYRAVESAAGAATIGEWLREVALHAARAPAEGPTILAELLALRTLVLNLLYRMSAGQRITDEEMQQLIDRADADKRRRASECLASAAGIPQ